MNYEIVLCDSFKKQIKRLKKRYPHIKEDVRAAILQLEENQKEGGVIPGGKGTRKLRVDNSDRQRGKSGGYRLIYYIVDTPTNTMYFLTMYSKTMRGNISAKEILELLRSAGLR